MKGTENFKNVIQNHLNVIASNDALFAKNLAKENKNIDDCITYIFNQVKQSGCNGFADDEIFNMAIHYYDEENIKVGKPIYGQVVVNHTDYNGKKVPAQQKESQDKPSDKKAKVVKMDPVNQISIFDIPGV